MAEYDYCPHCGASRIDMEDEIPCWHCKRLPYSNVVGSELPQKPRRSQRQGLPCFRLLLGFFITLVLIGGGGAVYLISQGDITIISGDVTPEIIVVTDGPNVRPTLPETTPSTEPMVTLINGSVFSTIPPSPAIRVGDDAATFSAQRTITSPTATLNPTSLPTATLAPTLTIPPFINCPNAPPTQLAVGMRAQVRAQSGVRLRESPSVDAEVVEALLQGQTFDVIGGPQCDGTFLWWIMRLDDGRSGWLAEGDTQNYYVIPAD